MSKVKFGAYSTLTVQKVALRGDNGDPFEIYLDGGPAGGILILQRYVSERTEIEGELEVFIYLDQDERPIATAGEPLAQVGGSAYLECSWVNEYGVFPSWGVMKDLSCPLREQKKRMTTDNSYIVYIHPDEENHRLVASAKIKHYLDEQPRGYKHGQGVDLLIWQRTDLGFGVIVDNRYPGPIYENQVFQCVHTGDRLKGCISTVRRDDRVDCTLQPTGQQHAEGFAEVLPQYLKDNGGVYDLDGKSEAEDTRRRFQVSKKVYKRAVGNLYKRHLITVDPLSTHLIE